VKLADLIVSLRRHRGGDLGRLAAWNAFLLQVYGDNLVAVSSKGRYVVADAAMLARRIYVLADVWLEEVPKAQASAAYRFRFDLPCPLPHSAFRTDELLRAMRRTLDTGRTRVTSDLERFVGQLAQPELILRLGDLTPVRAPGLRWRHDELQPQTGEAPSGGGAP
jgi:hypothetical protein